MNEALIVEDSTGELKLADSKEEVWISNALTANQLFFYFQFPIDGGKTDPGGSVIDWLVQQAGYVAMEFYGDWWHTGVKNEDADQLHIDRLQQQFQRVVILTSKEVWDQDSANRAIRREYV